MMLRHGWVQLSAKTTSGQKECASDERGVSSTTSQAQSRSTRGRRTSSYEAATREDEKQGESI
jgi:hypothetical protein